MLHEHFITEAEHFLPETVEEVHDYLLEEYPGIFRELPKEARAALAKLYWIGPNSIAYPITKDQVSKAPFSKGLCVFVDVTMQPFAYTLGPDIKTLKPWTGDRAITRKKAIDVAAHIFYVTPDPDTKSAIEFRQQEKPISAEQMKGSMLSKRWESIQPIIDKKIEGLKPANTVPKEQFTNELLSSFEETWEKLINSDAQITPTDISNMFFNYVRNKATYISFSSSNTRTKNIQSIERQWNDLKAAMARADYKTLADNYKSVFRVIDNINRIKAGKNLAY